MVLRVLRLRRYLEVDSILDEYFTNWTGGDSVGTGVDSFPLGVF